MFQRQLAWCVLAFAFAFVAKAQTSMQFKTVDGQVVTGRPILGKDNYVQVAIEGGGYTNLNWARLSQETLKNLNENKAIDKAVAQYAGIFIDPPSDRRSSSAKKTSSVTLKPVPRLDRPAGGSLIASPVMIVLLLILYAANIYAAYEISVFRQQPPALVCVVAAIAPLIGPAIFLAIPTRQATQEYTAEQAYEAPPVEEAPVVVEEAAAAPVQPEAPSIPQPVSYPRGQFTFNRRFFETKFAGFLKMVPGEAERDKVIVVKSARGEYTGQRFNRIEQNEVYLQVKKGNASEDVMIPFTEILEVIVKHKDS